MTSDNNTVAIYLKEINRIPLLSREEEKDLATRASKGDKVAKDKLISANLRFVVTVAKKYQNRGLDLEELISEGNIGLMAAVDHFDVSKGYHFISYAVWWIRQSILKAISEKSRMIRLPMNRANELVQIERTRKEFKVGMTEDEEITEIANILGMTVQHVRDMLNISSEVVSLDMPYSSVEKDKVCLGDFIEDTNYATPESYAIESVMKDEIHALVKTLPEKEAKVIRCRFGLNGDKAMSLKEVGEKFNLTKERIRQIEKKAISRLKAPSRSERLEAYVA